MANVFQPFDYDEARSGFSLSVPKDFNFAYDVVGKRATENDKTALICVDRTGENAVRHSYSDLDRISNRFANALITLGAEKGDFVFVMIPRIVEWYQVLLGCTKTGLVAMPGTNLLTAKDIEYRVKRSDARLAVVTEEHAHKVEQIVDNCPSLEYLILIGAPREGWTGMETMCAAEPDTVDRGAMPVTYADDLMLVYFTSGTTQMPKMVGRDHGYALAHSITGDYWMGLTEKDIHWTLTDTGWAKAAWGLLYPPLLAGATVLLYDGEGFDADIHLRLISEHGVTTFCAPPTIYRLLAQMDLSEANFSSLRHCFGAGEPLNPEAMRAWKKATGCEIYDGYGQTETINIVANFPGMKIRPGSMGRPVPGIKVDIIDDQGNVLGDGEVGHIAVRLTDPWPPGLFHGYFRDDAETDKAFRNGWYYTGDTATRDTDGYIWFVGRSDDIISSAGYRISPFEVESALIEHDAVLESAVVAKPDEVRGEIVMAYITLAPGFEASPSLSDDIQDFVKKQTAPYKYPRAIEFRDVLPKTISGKIRRVVLREEAAKK
ncbi:MAG: AMP-binding protein [Pseudomonadota bacterium]|nr:AMP-binding protein [Pseudomonadota bacterium]